MCQSCTKLTLETFQIYSKGSNLPMPLYCEISTQTSDTVRLLSLGLFVGEYGKEKVESWVNEE